MFVSIKLSVFEYDKYFRVLKIEWGNYYIITIYLNVLENFYGLFIMYIIGK